MLIRVNAPSKSLIAYGVVKQILSRVGLGPETRDARLAQSLRLYFPLHHDLAVRVRAASVSLTDKASASDQIRYFQRRRVRRNHIVVAEHIAAEHGPVQLQIGRCDSLDEPSREFLQVASSVAGWDIRYVAGSEITHSSAPYPEEARLRESLTRGPDSNQICDAAWEFINVGDAWSGTALARSLLSVEQSPRVWNLLAIGNAMLNESERAEFYYDQWATRGGPLDKVRALYGISMLYARHHPDGLRNLDRAGDFLEEGHRILQESIADSGRDDSLVFEEVFNRNGFALILFRRGEVDRAIQLLSDGIERLTSTAEKVAIHRSVLMYNLAQCYKRTARLDVAVSTYEQLILVDPYMPEYHLEFATCLSEIHQFDRAVRACRTAVELDGTLAVAWRMLALALTRCGHRLESAEAYCRAVQLEPEHATGRADAAYALLQAGMTDEAIVVLQAVDVESITARQADRHFSLLAEAHLKSGRREQAADELRRGLQTHPDSNRLAANLEQVIAR